MESAPKLRSRIMEDFTEEDLDWLRGLMTSPYFANGNDKADAILARFRDKNFIELAPATNRYVLLKGKYVYKFALDQYGFDDNVNEFNMTEELQPYVTKTYETNGLITIAEYVTLIKQKEFVDSPPHIREILREIFNMGYIFSDVGSITRNFANWGFRDDDTLVILDYGYIWHKDPRLMFCTRPGCGGRLDYTEDFDKFYCTNCGTKFEVIDMVQRMQNSEEAYKDQLKYAGKGALKIGLGAPSTFTGEKRSKKHNVYTISGYS